ncbi:hypothetical protein BD779DRAFT_1464703 [Infundibulicybe gibba]|nr:hypothetical protein BD779DRAFT_1464703 [Infundibulicybe gibba]
MSNLNAQLSRDVNPGAPLNDPGDERSELLHGQRDRNIRPPLAPILAILRSLDPEEPHRQDLLRPGFLGPPAATAFALLILLKLRAEKLHTSSTSGEIYEHWSQDQSIKRHLDTLETQLGALWEEYLNTHQPSTYELEVVLWAEFPATADDGSITHKGKPFINVEKGKGISLPTYFYTFLADAI